MGKIKNEDRQRYETIYHRKKKKKNIKIRLHSLHNLVQGNRWTMLSWQSFQGLFSKEAKAYCNFAQDRSLS